MRASPGIRSGPPRGARWTTCDHRRLGRDETTAPAKGTPGAPDKGALIEQSERDAKAPAPDDKQKRGRLRLRRLACARTGSANVATAKDPERKRTPVSSAPRPVPVAREGRRRSFCRRPRRHSSDGWGSHFFSTRRE